MPHVLSFSNDWKRARRRLDQHKSLLVISPIHYGKSSLFEEYAQEVAQQTLCIRLTSRVPTLEGTPDYGLLWEATKGHFRRMTRVVVDDRFSFMNALESALSKEDRRVLFIIIGAGRGNEENHRAILATFHEMKVSRPAFGNGKVTVLAADDYSLYYWIKTPYLLSPLHSYQPEVFIAPFDISEISDYVAAMAAEDGRKLSEHETKHIAQQAHLISGGHPGIVEELITGLLDRSWSLDLQSWKEYADAHYGNSTILKNLAKALSEDPEGYSRTALQYREPAFPEPNSPRIHVLIQLGILQPMPGTVCLCAGSLTRLIDEFNVRPGARTNAGTFKTHTRERIFVSGPLEKQADDLVILHISDLHVSSDYYKHRFPKTQRNPNEYTAGELLRDDLSDLNLLGKIDGVVLSGDFVWKGELDEFLRAREVVQEMLASIGVGIDKTLVIPGNHDVRWNPSENSTAIFGNNTSHEYFQTFLELLGKPPGNALDVVELTSKLGNIQLRILGFDSNRVEGPNAPGIGFVSRESLQAAKKYLDTHKQPDNGVQAYTWMAVHHHIFPASSLPLADAQQHKVSVLANTAELLDYANQWGVEVMLHGHEHQPSVTVASRWPTVTNDFAPIVSLGAGSFGVIRDYLGPFSRNHYYVVYRRPQDLVIRSRCQGAGGVKFIPHEDLQIPRSI